MREQHLPSEWERPNWHPDYGDTQTEFEHLRALAEAVLSSSPRFGVDLILPEPGLMYLQVTGPADRLAEAYSLCEDKGMEKRRYALFLSPGTNQEQELYADDVGGAVIILIPKSKKEEKGKEEGKRGHSRMAPT